MGASSDGVRGGPRGCPAAAAAAAAAAAVGAAAAVPESCASSGPSAITLLSCCIAAAAAAKASLSTGCGILLQHTRRHDMRAGVAVRDGLCKVHRSNHRGAATQHTLTDSSALGSCHEDSPRTGMHSIATGANWPNTEQGLAAALQATAPRWQERIRALQLWLKL
eukprot:351375-Chlamydomonas_euryale.AAC.14